MEEENVVIKGYKGFDKELKCRGFLYEVDKEYEQGGEIKCCNNGFHFCENPFDVFSYYPPNDSRYCEVHGSGKYDKDNNDSKISVSKIKIGFEIGLKGIIDAGIKFILDKVNWKESKATNTGDRSAATNTGDRSAASVEGSESIAIVTGYDCKAKGSLGCWIVLTERGEWDGNTYPIKCVKSFKVDGKKVKSNTWYKLINGKLTKCE